MTCPTCRLCARQSMLLSRRTMPRRAEDHVTDSALLLST